jgi:glutathione S-transferase
MLTPPAIEPIKLDGSSISYFTGKLENYFRVRGIEYELVSMRFPDDKKRLEKEVGVMQMPALQLADGRWMTDSSKIIQWFEDQFPEHGLLPRDPVLGFLSLLIEDYADEWLWRPAMHYRWHYTKGAELQSRHLADEVLKGVPLPGPLKRAYMRHRQRQGYTRGDGVTAENIAGVEAVFLNLLATLENVFQRRPYLLGDRPSIADIGLSGPFFRHFALDVVPLQIIRHQAPAVLEWVARLWNCDLQRCSLHYLESVPEDLGPLLDDIGNAYLPYLNANIAAVRQKQRRFDATINDVAYRGARASQYRVWCLLQLREVFHRLPSTAAEDVETLLKKHGIWQHLWQEEALPADALQEQDLPFRARNKMLMVNE